MLPPELLSAYALKMARESGQPTTPAEAEAAIVATIQQVAYKHARRMSFGSYEHEDISQESCLFGLELLAKGKYDVERPLFNYLHTHIKRRLHNLKRDRFFRPEAPCTCCDPFEPPDEPCERWIVWDRKNSAKRTLATPGLMPEFFDPVEAGPGGGYDRELLAEIDEFVDETYPSELRADYLRMRAGMTLDEPRSTAVVRPILKKFAGAANAA